MKPSSAILRRVSAVLQDAADGKPIDPREAGRLAPLVAPRRAAKKVLPLHPRPGKLTRKQLVDAVRPVVEARAKGCSEYSGDPFGILEATAEWDEFYGRRPVNVTVEKTWMLTRAEHRDKGHNRPSREHWDEAFKAHCERHGYQFRPRGGHHAIQRRAR